MLKNGGSINTTVDTMMPWSNLVTVREGARALPRLP